MELNNNKNILDRLIRIENKIDKNSETVIEFKTLLISHINNKLIHFSKSDVQNVAKKVSQPIEFGKKEYGTMAVFTTVIFGLFQIIRKLLP